MTTNYETKTANGHTVSANCWQGGDLNFQVHIDGELYTEGSSYIGRGDTPETEAKHQATQTAEDIDSGRLVKTGDGWKFADEEQ